MNLVKTNGIHREALIWPFRSLRISSSVRQRLTIPLVLVMAAGILLWDYGNQANAQITILHSFGDGTVVNDGARPVAGLVQTPSGDFFGATNSTVQNPNSNDGTAFQITPSGVLKVIYRFPTNSNLSTQEPLLYYYGQLIGTTLIGPGQGTTYGTVFRLKRSVITGKWGLQFWHKFTGSATDGGNPFGNVILGSDGSFYGTTSLGGPNSGGTVYKLDPTTHHLTNVYSFAKNDYWGPEAALVQGKDGNFYGSTFSQGPTIPLVQMGAFFKLAPNGQITVLPPSVNVALQAPLIEGSDGNFYGLSGEGDFLGSFNGVFSLTPSGTLNILQTFPVSPTGALVQGPNGSLYGITSGGGAVEFGTLFSISTDGKTFTVLHSFGDGTVPNDGLEPLGTLIVGMDGKLYGTTIGGGSKGLGTVFKFSP